MMGIRDERLRLLALLVLAGCGGAVAGGAGPEAAERPAEVSPTPVPASNAEPPPSVPHEVRYIIDGETVDHETFEALFGLLDVQEEPSVSGNLSNPMHEFGGSFANYEASRRDTEEAYTYEEVNQVHPDGSRSTTRAIRRQVP